MDQIGPVKYVKMLTTSVIKRRNITDQYRVTLMYFTQPTFLLPNQVFQSVLNNISCVYKHSLQKLDKNYKCAFTVLRILRNRPHH